MRQYWSFAWLRVIVAATGVLGGVALAGINIGLVTAQEVEFKPRWDGVEKPRREKKPANRPQTITTPETPIIYSFDRYSKQLRGICNLLERDHRRERVGSVAFDEVRSGASCKSCKAFLKEVIEQCEYRKKLAPLPTGTVVSADIPATPSGDVVPSSPTAASDSPGAARYPLTELLDRAGELSSELYERDRGEGALFESVTYFVNLLMKRSDLTPGERDYYGIFTTYLLSAWEGRPESPLESGAASKQEVQSLFKD
jgi:hypothetical protein